MNGRRRHRCAGTTATPGLSVQEGHAGVKSPYLPNSTIAVFLSGPFFFSLRRRSSLERVCCFSSSNSAGKDLKRCLHPVPDPSARRFIACGCYGAITFYIYMSSSIVKDPGTSHKLLPCCRAQQATLRTLRARGGGFIQGRRSLDERLCCPGGIPPDNTYLLGTESPLFRGLIPSPQTLRDGARVFVHPELRAPGSALRHLGGHGENCPPFPAGSAARIRAGKARRGRQAARLAAAKGIYYCSAGGCRGGSAAQHRLSAFHAASGVAVVRLDMARASDVLPGAARSNVLEHLFLRLARSARFRGARPKSAKRREATRRPSVAAGAAADFAQGAGDISVPRTGSLQFSPASRGGSQSCRSVPSISAASLPHPSSCPGMRACRTTAPASRAGCPGCSLAPLNCLHRLLSGLVGRDLSSALSPWAPSRLLSPRPSLGGSSRCIRNLNLGALPPACPHFTSPASSPSTNLRLFREAAAWLPLCISI